VTDLDYLIEDTEVRKIVRRIKDDLAGKHFSDLVDHAGRQYVDIVMQGGGVLGIALVGFTYVLEQVGLRFRRIGGTSAGAINALLLAAAAPAADERTVRVAELLCNLDFRMLADGDRKLERLLRLTMTGKVPWRNPATSLRAYCRLKNRQGLFSAAQFIESLDEALSRWGVHSTEDLKNRVEQPIERLRSRHGNPLSPDCQIGRLSIIAADISTQTKVDFPRMAPMYWANPGAVRPSAFVRASMAVPLVFEPFIVENIPQGKLAADTWLKLAAYEDTIPGRCVLVDGGIMSNFPIDMFHAAGIPLAPTFGVKLGKSRRSTCSVTSLPKVLAKVFDTARHTLDYDFVARNPDYEKLVACIDTDDSDWLNFAMDAKGTQKLFLHGAKAAEAFLYRFNWPKYKDQRAQTSGNLHRAVAHAV
jgi:NTE family protein